MSGTPTAPCDAKIHLSGTFPASPCSSLLLLLACWCMPWDVGSAAPPLMLKVLEAGVVLVKHAGAAGFIQGRGMLLGTSSFCPCPLQLCEVLV